MVEKDKILGCLEARLPDGLRLLEQMVGINSFTVNPDGVNRLGRFTAEAFAPLGFTPEFVPSTNPAYGRHLILTRTGRTATSIALISHLDTVFPPEEEARNHFKWQPEGDRIYGPGTHDIKGGTMMMWLILQTLQAIHPDVFENLTWKLFLNSSEETLSPDFGDVCRSRFVQPMLAALVFESEGRLGEEHLLVVARKGRGTWRARAIGRAAHAGTRHSQGANAILQLSRTLERITALTDYKRDLTFNVATVHGGTVLNRVPHEAEAAGEFRAFSKTVFQEATTALLALSGRGSVTSQADGFACGIQIEITGESRPWPRNPATDRLADIFCNAGAQLGIPIGVEQRGGLSDGNLLWDSVPTLDGLGPWGENDHCSEHSPDGTKVPEYIHVPSILPKALLNTAGLVFLASEPTWGSKLTQ